MNNKRFQIYLSPDQHQKIKKLALSENLTMAAIIRKAIESYLSKTEQQTKSSQDPIWSIIGIAPEQINQNLKPKGEK